MQTFTNANGCDSTITLHLTIHPIPMVAISGETSFCEGGSTILTASGAETYEWSTTEFGAEYHVALAGTYSVVGTDTNGCTATASVTVSEITISTETHVVEVGENSYLEASQDNAEYQWINCDTHEPIEGATQQQFTPVVTGSYACVITLGECTDTSDCVQATIIGITEYGDGIISLYPNPTDGIFTIQLNAEILTLNPEIQVFDVYGRLLEVVGISDAHRTSLQTARIDLSRYSTGVYFVKLVNGGKAVAVKKVVRK